MLLRDVRPDVLVIATTTAVPRTHPAHNFACALVAWCTLTRVTVQVTYSKTFKGAAVLAGGPFYCAYDNLVTAREFDAGP